MFGIAEAELEIYEAIAGMIRGRIHADELIENLARSNRSKAFPTVLDPTGRFRL